MKMDVSWPNTSGGGGRASRNLILDTFILGGESPFLGKFFASLSPLFVKTVRVLCMGHIFDSIFLHLSRQPRCSLAIAVDCVCLSCMRLQFACYDKLFAQAAMSELDASKRSVSIFASTRGPATPPKIWDRIFYIERRTHHLHHSHHQIAKYEIYFRKMSADVCVRCTRAPSKLSLRRCHRCDPRRRRRRRRREIAHWQWRRHERRHRVRANE